MNNFDKELRAETGKVINTAMDLLPACPVCGAEYSTIGGDWIIWQCGTTLRLVPPYRGKKHINCRWREVSE